MVAVDPSALALGFSKDETVVDEFAANQIELPDHDGVCATA